jgi:NADP-dependent 3-hydroxy acid dehydrogenase YdfG
VAAGDGRQLLRPRPCLQGGAGADAGARQRRHRQHLLDLGAADRQAVRAYSPSKFAVNSYSESLRQEVGAAGIRVCVVEPGATESECAENITILEWRVKMREHVTKPGAMKAQDIADAVLFALGMPRRANVSEILVRPTIDVAAQF